jgi:hypothetical protein
MKMGWYKKLLNRLKGNKEVQEETEESEQKIEEIEVEEDIRKILTDKDGEDLVCPLCENQDNETGKYYPIREGDKRRFHGDTWHKKCLKVFLKEARKGGMT